MSITKSERYVAVTTHYVYLNSAARVRALLIFGRRRAKKKEPACKPGSVEGNHSSGTRVAASL
jgi:hypothetical protein